eukprot:1924781-Amphidinium_carterae.1
MLHLLVVLPDPLLPGLRALRLPLTLCSLPALSAGLAISRHLECVSSRGLNSPALPIEQSRVRKLKMTSQRSSRAYI